MKDYNGEHRLDRPHTDLPREHWANPAPYRDRSEALEGLAEILRWTLKIASDGITPNATRGTMALKKLRGLYQAEAFPQLGRQDANNWDTTTVPFRNRLKVEAP